MGAILDLPCTSGILWFRHSDIIQLKLEYLWDQLANVDQILYEALLGCGKGCIRFRDKLDQNSGFVFFCSSISVVLFDTPGISRCLSQHVSVESSSLFHHSIYVWFICFPVMIIDELENLHTDRNKYVLSHDRSLGRGWVPVKAF